MAYKTTTPITENQADHIDKYELDKLYKFTLNRISLEIVFEGVGSEHKAKKFDNLLNSLN